MYSSVLVSALSLHVAEGSLAGDIVNGKLTDVANNSATSREIFQRIAAAPIFQAGARDASEPEFVNLLRSPGIDFKESVPPGWETFKDFKESIPPGWETFKEPRNRLQGIDPARLEIDSWVP